jgi:hypothetical protein
MRQKYKKFYGSNKRYKRSEIKMRCYQADGMVLIQFTIGERQVLEEAADLLENLANTEGTKYMVNNDDGEVYDLKRLLQAASKIDFTTLEEV